MDQETEVPVTGLFQLLSEAEELSFQPRPKLKLLPRKVNFTLNFHFKFKSAPARGLVWIRAAGGGRLDSSLASTEKLRGGAPSGCGDES